METATSAPTLASLVVLTPTRQSVEHNTVEIHRENDIDSNRLLHMAGGNLIGIAIYRYDEGAFIDEKPDIGISFSVGISDGKENHKQERRTLAFYIEGNDDSVNRSVVHLFFKQLTSNLPNSYVTFMKKILVMMQQGYPEIKRITLDFKTAAEEEKVVIPEAAQYDSSSEAEEVTVGHIQEVLEHAYPNGLTVQMIAQALKFKEEEAEKFLHELTATGIVRKEGDEWIRVDTRNVDAITRQHHAPNSSSQPTIAIITCLFVEKQAVDSIIEGSSVIHKYKSGGESNVYTLGNIGSHKVVATKLAIIGNSREAITSAGSITTRLLGNFQRIEHVFVVGIGGAVPHFTDASLHARLGDVIVSASRPDAYTYCHDLIIDRKTDILTGFAVRNYNPTSNIIQQTIEENFEEIKTNWNSLTKEATHKLNTQCKDADFSAPDPLTDILAIPAAGGQMMVIPHPNQERKSFELHTGGIGSISTWRKLADNSENEEETAGQIRERFTSEYKLRALDVGFDSVIASIVGSRIDSWTLIRGVADYQNGQSRASRKWQAYASARAAAAVRSIIEKLPNNN